MGLRESAARRAVKVTHVLVVEVPGWGLTRMRVESELARRGWTLATSPADTDVLLVCGSPGQQLDAACSHLWSQLPGPRARASVVSADDVVPTFARLTAELLDEAAQQLDANTRSREPVSASGDSVMAQPVAHSEHGSDEHAMPTDMPTHESMDMGSHESMDMDMDMDMDMPMPGGIPLASGGPDRDGLEMDVLHVPLGPVLPNWPAGLVVRCALKGDVIVHAEVGFMSAAAGSLGDGSVGAGSFRSVDDERRRTVIRLFDAAVNVLALSGWSSAAGRARRIRDDVASGTALIDVATRIESLAARVKRSLLLRWGLKGIVADAASGAQRIGYGEAQSAHARLVEWLDEAGRSARDTAHSYDPPDFPELEPKSLQLIAGLVTGTDVASARLIIASLALDTSLLAASGDVHS